MDLRTCKGKSFTAKIGGHEVKNGKIQVERGEVFLCQNEYSGSACEDKLGYSFSYTIGNSGNWKGLGYAVKNLRIINHDPETYKDFQEGDLIDCDGSPAGIIGFRHGNLVIPIDEDGDARSNYTCNKLFEAGYRLHVESLPEEEMVELTLEEVAKLKGIDVSRLRIKD